MSQNTQNSTPNDTGTTNDNPVLAVLADLKIEINSRLDTVIDNNTENKEEISMLKFHDTDIEKNQCNSSFQIKITGGLISVSIWILLLKKF